MTIIILAAIVLAPVTGSSFTGASHMDVSHAGMLDPRAQETKTVDAGIPDAEPPCYVRTPGRCDAHFVAARTAQNRRDAQDPTLAEKLTDFPVVGLTALGTIGGATGDDAACDRILPYLTDTRPPVRLVAATGLARCGRVRDVPAVTAQLDREESRDVRIRLLEALGFAGGLDAVSVLEARFNGGEDRAAALYGLIHASAYHKPSASGRSGLDLGAVMDLVEAGGGEDAYLAAYFTSRLSDVPAEIDGERVRAAYSASLDPSLKAILLRLSGQYAEDAAMTAFLTDIAREETGHLGALAVDALARINKSDSITDLILTYATNDDSYVAATALQALAGRNGQRVARAAAAQAALSSEDLWLQRRGLGLLYAVDRDAATAIARAWWVGDNAYLAQSAALLLAADDSGRQVVNDWLTADPDSARARIAANMLAQSLDPQTAAAVLPRPGPDYADGVAATKSLIALETSRGKILIALNPNAPFAAAHISDYVAAGHMDGTYFHRVIPGFVAQWGLGDSPAQLDWGTVRDTWRGSMHVPGTVGIATAGPDSGSTQFFINTVYNITNDGRYTVIGQVVEGFDTALAMQEGDRIIAAQLQPAAPPTRKRR